MKAGFGKACITPQIGARMYGFAGRDRESGARAVHDDLYVRVLFIIDGDSEALIAGVDLLFFEREIVDGIKRAVREETGLPPEAILLNCSHTHAGPAIGEIWGHAAEVGVEERARYIAVVTAAMVGAAKLARQSAVEVTVSAGSGWTSLPVSRRRPDGSGGVEWAPYGDGVVCGHLPVCVFEDENGETVGLLFSVSCHPSTVNGCEISADFPGVAMDMLDRNSGRECSLFLQGAGGDAKASVVATKNNWRSGTWEDVAEAGCSVASGVIRVLRDGLTRVKPRVECSIVEMEWPLAERLSQEGLREIAGCEDESSLKRAWAGRQLQRYAAGESLRRAVAVRLHGMELGDNLRLIGLEGEAVAEIGLQILRFYEGAGVTFPLGYTDGMRAYLPTSRMLDEGGYEVDSFYEYGQPARFERGTEQVLEKGLQKIAGRKKTGKS